MPDTGASQSIVSAAIARDANLCVKPTLTELRNASNGVMTLLGEQTQCCATINILYVRAQRLINLEIPVLVRSLKSSNVELG